VEAAALYLLRVLVPCHSAPQRTPNWGEKTGENAAATKHGFESRWSFDLHNGVPEILDQFSEFRRILWMVVK
jgi:hypothetical protein